MYKALRVFVIFSLFLVGCQSLVQTSPPTTSCAPYTRRESQQSDVALVVPEKGTLILEDAVECIGIPEWYRADITLGPHGSVKRADLWYPAKGIVIVAIEWHDAPVRSDTNEIRSMPIERIFYIPLNREPQSIAETIYREFNAEAQTQRIVQLRPWEGWNEVVVILPD